MTKSKELMEFQFVPAVRVVPSVQFRFMKKIKCEALRSALWRAFLQDVESLPWGRKWPINGSSTLVMKVRTLAVF
jgi:hypothetical protein